MTPSRRRLYEEVALVLSLSLLPSVFYALISLFEQPIAGTTVALFGQTSSGFQVAREMVQTLFEFAPVWLVLYLLRLRREQVADFGLAADRVGRDVAWGTMAAIGLFVIGAVGYLVVVNLGIQRFVIPVPARGHWWTVPLLLAGSLAAGVVEEVVMTAYLLRRLQQLGWSAAAAVAVSAVFRGAYHLYQGFGGALGSLLLGALFGWWFLRTRRAWPLVIAHFLFDALSGLSFLAVSGQCIAGVCFE